MLRQFTVHYPNTKCSLFVEKLLSHLQYAVIRQINCSVLVLCMYPDRFHRAHSPLNHSLCDWNRISFFDFWFTKSNKKHSIRLQADKPKICARAHTTHVNNKQMCCAGIHITVYTYTLYIHIHSILTSAVIRTTLFSVQFLCAFVHYR